MCGMLLAELGAAVLRIDRVTPSGLGFDLDAEDDLLHRSRPAVAVDLRRPEGVELVLALAGRGGRAHRRLPPGGDGAPGLGPTRARAATPRLVFGRITGWGQTGPLAESAGHDLDYIALTGALHAIGRAGQPPTPPLNLVGDFGGGALYLAVGVPGGARRGAAVGPGAGGRRRDGRRRRVAADRGLPPCARPGSRTTGAERTSSTAAPTTTTSTRRGTAATSPSPPSSRSSTRSSCGG